ncbi:hypothetical protein CSUI_007352 [Cystoisospora suis]|uniref:Uncharacterized protein n=1 Tax=Cystoisospora suis TaxID=483139 RepID=A0A2C6JVG4_9APIC|nr:hypothetical protein CSUI_007352 [Cystoisospora suis]
MAAADSFDSQSVSSFDRHRDELELLLKDGGSDSIETDCTKVRPDPSSPTSHAVDTESGDEAWLRFSPSLDKSTSCFSSTSFPSTAASSPLPEPCQELPSCTGAAALLSSPVPLSLFSGACHPIATLEDPHALSLPLTSSGDSAKSVHGVIPSVDSESPLDCEGPRAGPSPLNGASPKAGCQSAESTDVQGSECCGNSGTPEVTPRVTWYPGFRLPLGAEGRQVLLRRLRRAYHASPPDTRDAFLASEGLVFSRMPFATVSELFHLAHLLGVFDFAVQCSEEFGGVANAAAAAAANRTRGRASVSAATSKGGVESVGGSVRVAGKRRRTASGAVKRPWHAGSLFGWSELDQQAREEGSEEQSTAVADLNMERNRLIRSLAEGEVGSAEGFNGKMLGAEAGSLNRKRKRPRASRAATADTAFYIPQQNTHLELGSAVLLTSNGGVGRKAAVKDAGAERGSQEGGYVNKGQAGQQQHILQLLQLLGLAGVADTVPKGADTSAGDTNGEEIPTARVVQCNTDEHEGFSGRAAVEGETRGFLAGRHCTESVGRREWANIAQSGFYSDQGGNEDQSASRGGVPLEPRGRNAVEGSNSDVKPHQGHSRVTQDRQAASPLSPRFVKGKSFTSLEESELVDTSPTAATSEWPTSDESHQKNTVHSDLYQFVDTLFALEKGVSQRPSSCLSQGQQDAMDCVSRVYQALTRLNRAAYGTPHCPLSSAKGNASDTSSWNCRPCCMSSEGRRSMPESTRCLRDVTGSAARAAYYPADGTAFFEGSRGGNADNGVPSRSFFGSAELPSKSPSNIEDAVGASSSDSSDAAVLKLLRRLAENQGGSGSCGSGRTCRSPDISASVTLNAQLALNLQLLRLMDLLEVGSDLSKLMTPGLKDCRNASWCDKERSGVDSPVTPKTASQASGSTAGSTSPPVTSSAESSVCSGLNGQSTGGSRNGSFCEREAAVIEGPGMLDCFSLARESDTESRGLGSMCTNGGLCGAGVDRRASSVEEAWLQHLGDELPQNSNRTASGHEPCAGSPLHQLLERLTSEAKVPYTTTASRGKACGARGDKAVPSRNNSGVFRVHSEEHRQLEALLRLCASQEDQLESLGRSFQWPGSEASLLDPSRSFDGEGAAMEGKLLP